jgi:hypothetical protein
MTSPVDTSVKYFSSDMPNAPALSGTVGSLISLLDACLKDGFNSLTLTSLVVASGVATATYTGTHAALVDSVVLIAGVTGGPTGWADLNGEQKVVTKPGATSITFATAVPDGTATGTISMKMAPLGFTKPYSGTNLAAYKSGDVASTGCLLRVDDTGTTAARVVGYEAMTDVNTGSGPFPTAAQMSGGGYWTKSQSANSTGVVWSLHGDGRIFYLNVQSASGASAGNQIGVNRYFGDLVPLKPGGDAYACGLNYSTASTLAAQYDGSVSGSANGSQSFPRDYTGLGSAVLHLIYAFMSVNSSLHYSGATILGLGSFPSNIDGGLWLSQNYVSAAVPAPPRALFPGLYHSMQSDVWTTFKQGNRAPGGGPLAGKTLIAATGNANVALSNSSTSTNTGIVFFDVTGPWR